MTNTTPNDDWLNECLDYIENYGASSTDVSFTSEHYIACRNNAKQAILSHEQQARTQSKIEVFRVVTDNYQKRSFINELYAIELETLKTLTQQTRKE